MGQIAKTACTTDMPRTALANDIFIFMLFISAVAFTAALICFFVWLGWLHPEYPSFMTMPSMLIVLVSVIVGVLPAGLPVSVTSAMTIIARRMAKQNVLVKHLATVETLGSVDIIACDKTGTLTQNRMCVTSG